MTGPWGSMLIEKKVNQRKHRIPQRRIFEAFMSWWIILGWPGSKSRNKISGQDCSLMPTQWCIHHDAKMTMLLMYACMRCISMMHTCMSWWCTWFAPHNHSPVTNTLLALYPWERIQIWNYMYQNYLIIKTKKNHLRSAWASCSENRTCS